MVLLLGRRPRRRRRLLVRLCLLGVAALGAWLFLLDRTVREGFRDDRWTSPVRLRAARREIAAGVDLRAAGILEELDALGYRRVAGRPEEPGTYHRDRRHLDLFLRPAAQADAFRQRPAFRVLLELERGRVRKITRLDTSETVRSITLEPRLLAGAWDGHWSPRRPLAFSELPPHVVDAVLAAEDGRFMTHHGIDPPSLMRALETNWRAGEVRQGGSTITQQLIKYHFLSPERTIARKLREIPMALLLEWRFTKREILAAYLGTVYLGHDGLVGVRGLAQGAWTYFGKRASELTLGQAAMLAGVIRAPNRYSPLRHPRRALARRNEVIEKLSGLGWISPDEARRARSEPAGIKRSSAAADEAYFVQHVARELEAAGVPLESLGAGSEVFTSLDLRLQRIASEAARHESQRLRGAQVAVLALDPTTGAIRALVGGRAYSESQLDRATRTRRPIGSLFKPFVVLAAFDDPSSGITPTTLVSDEPVTVGTGAARWQPQNSDDRFHGTVSLADVLARSLNVPTVRLAQRLGIDRLAAFGDRLGLTPEPLPRVPSIALGAFESSLLDVTAAYSVFPGSGLRVEPRGALSVKAPSGVVIHQTSGGEQRVASASAAQAVHTMLEAVVDRGTARAIRGAGLEGAMAGKTGTSSEQRDAWYVGYTPSLVLGVWIGFDDDRPLHGTASELAVPLWAAIARRALAGQEVTQFSGTPPRVARMMDEGRR